MSLTKYRTGALSLLLAASISVPRAATAQQPPGGQPADERTAADPRINDEQMALNDEAVQAIFDENYVRAVSLLQQSLLIGELNVTYLNLGRAYQKAGKCEKARQAYAKALTAPAVHKPSPKLVEKQTRKYMAELDEGCAADKDAGAATAARDESSPDVSTPDATGTSADAPRADAHGANVLGWTLTVAGAALVGGGVGMHFVAEAERDDLRQPQTNDQGLVDGMTQRQFEEREQTANTYDTIGLAGGIVGGVVAATGVYLLLSDDADDRAGSARLWLGDEAAGVSWAARF